MTIVNKRGLLFIIPVLFFIVQCNNRAKTNAPAMDSTVSAEDTSRLAGASSADAVSAAVVNNALVFHIDDSMEINKPYKASLSIGKSIPLDYLKEQVRKLVAGKADTLYTDTTLRVASEMRARLRELDPTVNNNFRIDIMGTNAEIQSINQGEGNEAYWEWTIVPLKEGSHELELVIEIVVDEKHNVYLPSRTIPVMIRSTPETFSTKFSAFMEKNWQWMITAIIIPIFIAWFSTRIKQRQQSTSSTAKPTRGRRKRK